MPLRNKRTNGSSDGTTSLRTSFRKEWIATPSDIGPNSTIRRKHCYAPACEKDLKVQKYSRCEEVFGGGKRRGENEFYVNVTMHNFRYPSTSNTRVNQAESEDTEGIAELAILLVARTLLEEATFEETDVMAEVSEDIALTLATVELLSKAIVSVPESVTEIAAAEPTTL